MQRTTLKILFIIVLCILFSLFPRLIRTPKPLPTSKRRWIVERTFGWLMRHRRVVRDYERTEAMAQSWIRLAMIRIQLRRLA